LRWGAIASLHRPGENKPRRKTKRAPVRSSRGTRLSMAKPESKEAFTKELDSGRSRTTMAENGDAQPARPFWAIFMIESRETTEGHRSRFSSHLRPHADRLMSGKEQKLPPWPSVVLGLLRGKSLLRCPWRRSPPDDRPACHRNAPCIRPESARYTRRLP
jgi:hypothetical protein